MLVGQLTSGRFARENAAWLAYFGPKHEAGKLTQQITKGTLRATESWTDGRPPEDDMCVELDYELAVALACATEGPARSTVLKVTHVAPSHGFVAWQALLDGHAPKSSNDPAVALQPTTCDTQPMQGRKGEAHGMVIESGGARVPVQGDRAQKTFLVREVMPKDIMREVLTGPRNSMKSWRSWRSTSTK